MLQYPDWALALLSLLILVAMLPVPLGFIHSVLQGRALGGPRGPAGFQAVPTDDECQTPMTDVTEQTAL